MTNPEDVIMVDAPEDDDVQVGEQTQSKIAQNLRRDPPTPNQVDQFPLLNIIMFYA